MAKTKYLQKFITVMWEGKIEELDNVQGSILNPFWCDLNKIRLMIGSGKIVYEHSYTNPNLRVRLTLDNYDDLNIYPDNPEIDDTSFGNEYCFQILDLPNQTRYITSRNVYVEFVD